MNKKLFEPLYIFLDHDILLFYAIEINASTVNINTKL
jgi:hypothetical protein